MTKHATDEPTPVTAALAGRGRDPAVTTCG